MSKDISTIYRKHSWNMLFCSYNIISFYLHLDVMKGSNWCISFSLCQTWCCDVFGGYSWSLHPYPFCCKLFRLAQYTCFGCKWLLGSVLDSCELIDLTVTRDDRWNIDNEFLVWYLSLLYAKHPLGQNGCLIRFFFWTFPLFI